MSIFHSCEMYGTAEEGLDVGAMHFGAVSRRQITIYASAGPSKLRSPKPGPTMPPMETTTRWYHYVAYFLGGAFLANTIPHLVNGISGSPFQSPFASPPGEGLSSSTVNVLWGLLNLAIGYLLVCRVGKFDLRKTLHVVVLGAGILIISVLSARGFGRFHGGL